MKNAIPAFTPVRTVFRTCCIAAIVALSVVSATESASHSQQVPSAGPPETSHNLIGKQAPAFTVAMLDGGRRVSLADYRGKVVLVNFWATWCGACKVEMPWLAQLREKYADQGFEVLGIVTDNAPVAKISALTQKNGVKYPVLMCNHPTAQAYGGLPELPASFFVDRSGKVIAEMGSADSQDEIEATVRKALRGSRP